MSCAFDTTGLPAAVPLPDFACPAGGLCWPPATAQPGAWHLHCTCLRLRKRREKEVKEKRRGGGGQEEKEDVKFAAPTDKLQTSQPGIKGLVPHTPSTSAEKASQ